MEQGRSKRRKRARGILAQFKKSGLSQREFAEQEGVSLSTLSYWLRRERLEKELRGETALVAVAPTPVIEVRPGLFVLELGGLRLEVPRDVTIEEWRRIREAWAS